MSTDPSDTAGIRGSSVQVFVRHSPAAKCAPRDCNYRSRKPAILDLPHLTRERVDNFHRSATVVKSFAGFWGSRHVRMRADFLCGPEHQRQPLARLHAGLQIPAVDDGEAKTAWRHGVRLTCPHKT